jgi:phosphonopyruvate decarboxylase
MIAPHALFAALRRRGVRFFAGVPDSQLKEFCAYVDDHGAGPEHVITANEGNAVAMAVGHHLATGQIPVVYMQNSGLGNAVNPLTSLADTEVYRIPLLLIIGWRGEPGVQDEPQHITQGRITPAQLDLLGIPHAVLEAVSDLDAVLNVVFDHVLAGGSPAAVLVRKGTFERYDGRRQHADDSTLVREEALAQLLGLMRADDLVVATTGKTSREVFDLRSRRSEPHRDFLTVGGMGHAASIALGVALARPGRRVVCLDGDGSMLMHLGAMAITGDLRPANLVHVLLNNAAHESVGGQPTVAGRVDFEAVARACGYTGYVVAADAAGIDVAWAAIEGAGGPMLFEIKIRLGSRSDLGRPTTSPEQNKDAFMAHARG